MLVYLWKYLVRVVTVKNFLCDGTVVKPQENSWWSSLWKGLMRYQTAKQEKPRNVTSLGVKHFKSTEEKTKKDDTANWNALLHQCTHLVCIETLVRIVGVTQYTSCWSQKVIYEKWKTVKKHAALIVTAMCLKSSVRTTDWNLPFLSRSKRSATTVFRAF